VIQDSENTGGLPGLTIVDAAQLAIGPEGDIYLSQVSGGDFSVHHSTDAGVTFSGPDHVTGRRIAFGTGFTTAVNPSFTGNRFRTRAVRQIGADPDRPGQVYAAEVVLLLDPLGKEIDSADVFFARSTDHGETWQTTFQLGPNHASVLNDDNDGQKATGPKGRRWSVVRPTAARRGYPGKVGVIWYDTRRRRTTAWTSSAP
jgi:hypothetical protein